MQIFQNMKGQKSQKSSNLFMNLLIHYKSYSQVTFMADQICDIIAQQRTIPPKCVLTVGNISTLIFFDLRKVKTLLLTLLSLSP